MTAASLHAGVQETQEQHAAAGGAHAGDAQLCNVVVEIQAQASLCQEVVSQVRIARERICRQSSARAQEEEQGSQPA